LRYYFGTGFDCGFAFDVANKNHIRIFPDRMRNPKRFMALQGLSWVNETIKIKIPSPYPLPQAGEGQIQPAFGNETGNLNAFLLPMDSAKTKISNDSFKLDWVLIPLARLRERVG
jgi:hypothetical protein